MNLPRRSRRSGFSLFALLAFLAFPVLLLGLLVPSVQRVREAANRTMLRNNLKNLALACHNCNDTFKRLPPMYCSAEQPAKPFAGKGTVHFYLLPFLEQGELFRAAGSPPDPYTTQVYTKAV